MGNPVSVQNIQFYQNTQGIRDKIQQKLPAIGAALVLITLAGVALAGLGLAMGSPIGVIGICLATVGGLGVASAVAAGVILHILNKKGKEILVPKNLYQAIEQNPEKGQEILDKLDAKEFWRFMRYTSKKKDVPESIINAINTQPVHTRLASSLLGCNSAFVQRLINKNKCLAQEVTSILKSLVEDLQTWDKLGSMEPTLFTHEFVVKFSPLGQTLILAFYPESDKKKYQDHYGDHVSTLLDAIRPTNENLVTHISTFA